MADGAPEYLQKLCPELMLMVMEALPDLASLSSLVIASTNACEVFRAYPTRIINYIVDKMPVHLQRYPRWIAIVASLQSPTSPYITYNRENTGGSQNTGDPNNPDNTGGSQNTGDPNNPDNAGGSQNTGNPDNPDDPGNRYDIRKFIDNYTALHGLTGLNLIRTGGYSFPPLLKELRDTKGPLAVLIAARQIDLLAPVCLSRPMAVLSELERGHPPAPVDTYINVNGVVRDLRMPNGDSFLGVDDNPQPPSYVERTRVEEALWQLLTNSYSRLIPDIPRHGPSRENIDKWHLLFRPRELDITELVAGGWNREYFRGDPFDCVQDTLRELLDAPVAKFLAHDRSKKQLNKARTRLQKARQVPPLAGTWGSVKDPPIQSGWQDILGRSRDRAGKPNYGMSYYQRHYLGSGSAGPGGIHDFRALSRLGVSIWDTDRLISLNLAYRPGHRPFIDGDHAHWAWRSILIQEVTRIANKNVTRRRIDPALAAWVKTWTRTGATFTRGVDDDIHIHRNVDLRTYTGPSQTPREHLTLTMARLQVLVGMRRGMEAYFLAPRDPAAYPATI